MSRIPSLGDGIVFYGADVASVSLQDDLKKELRKKNPNGWTVLFEILGIAGGEMVKAGVNSQVAPPFTSIQDAEAQRTGKRRVN
jgi:hypothetical protein